MSSSIFLLSKKVVFRSAACLAALALSVSSTSAYAQSRESNFAVLPDWTVRAEFEKNAFSGCYAERVNPFAQAGFGSRFRIVLHKVTWYIATDFNSSPNQNHVVTVDGRSYGADLKYDGSRWSIMKIGEDLRKAIGAGRQIVLNLDPEGPKFAVSGSNPVFAKIFECSFRKGVPLR